MCKGIKFSAQTNLRFKCFAFGVYLATYDTEDPVEVGKSTIYVVEVRNVGTSDATNVKLVNKIPKEMEFISAEGNSKFHIRGRQIIFDPIPTLQPEEKAVYKIVCRVKLEGSCKNQAILSYDQFPKEIIDEEGTSSYK